MRQGDLYALVDCDNAYATWHRVFAPRLRLKPIVVLSNNDGCAIARSKEAKAFGIKMGDAYHLNQKQWAAWGVVIFSSNYTLYGDMSARVMQLLANYTPELEVYSIDEAFLNFAGFADPEAHARTLRADLLQGLDTPVGVGISTTKTLAKVANRTAKKDPHSGGVCLLDTESKQTAALEKLVLDDVWGVGRRLPASLAAIGITTPLQLRDADPSMIRDRFNVVLQRTVLELRGVSCIDLERDSPDAKTIRTERSFGRYVETFDELAEALCAYVSRAAEKMRRKGLATAHVAVMVTTNKWKPDQAQYYATRPVRLTIATTDTGRLIRAALHGLRAIYRPGFKYKKTGILLLDLVPADSVQGSLFIQPDTPERVILLNAVDQLNKRYGRDRVRWGASGIDRAWRMKAEFPSPAYTTRFGELLRV